LRTFFAIPHNFCACNAFLSRNYSKPLFIFASPPVYSAYRISATMSFLPRRRKYGGPPSSITKPILDSASFRRRRSFPPLFPFFLRIYLTRSTLLPFPLRSTDRLRKDSLRPYADVRRRNCRSRLPSEALVCAQFVSPPPRRMTHA